MLARPPDPSVASPRVMPAMYLPAVATCLLLAAAPL